MSTAICYAAKSTSDKRGSIPDQLADCRAMCEREGWTVVGDHAQAQAPRARAAQPDRGGNDRLARI